MSTNFLLVNMDMSNRFKVNFGEEWVIIECLDNSTIRRWFNTVKEVYTSTPIVRHENYPVIDENKNLKTSYDSLMQSMETLANFGVAWTETEPAEFNFDQRFCNRIHRYFTTLVMTGNSIDTKSRNFFTPKTTSPKDHMLFSEALQNINNQIHYLENSCITEQRIKFEKQLKSMHVLPARFLQDDYYKTHKFHRFMASDYRYHTFDHHDVIFGPEILGKTLITSFMDDDNPKNIDTDGHNGWFGGFKILVDDSYSRLYQDPMFDEWLARNNMVKEKARGNFPIGNIVDSSCSVKKIFQECADKQNSIVFLN